MKVSRPGTRSSRPLIAAGLMAAAMAAAIVSPDALAGGRSAAGQISTDEARMVRERAAVLINNIRAKLDACGDQGMLAVSSDHREPAAVPVRPALTWNDQLAEVALRHSEAMAQQAFFDHVDPQGRTVGKRVTRVGYRWRVVGENLAAGHATIDEAVRGWLLSTGHCEVMIDERFTEFGLARVDPGNASDPYGSYWTLVVARPKQGPTLSNPPAMAMR
ncbi:MAG: CAP domain-containing protein [Burkholderiaceae bacterium]